MKPAVALLTAFALVGCTQTGVDTTSPAPALKLVSYSSCDDLLSSVREAAKKSVGPWGFTNGGRHWFSGGIEDNRAVAPAAPAEAAGKGAPVQGQDYSGTNTHTAGVDEPDLVKTDGKRIVVVIGNSLHIIDAATRRETSRLPLESGAFQLLLHGDRALVLSHGNSKIIPFDAPSDSRLSAPGWFQPTTHLQLIDLNGTPKISGDFKIEAGLVDARQVGGMARVIVRNTPQIAFPQWREGAKDEQRLADNRAIIDRTSIESWLPS
ncbi:MAG TPA: benzoate transporter, partial [Micromonosporaceae bacterium]|nr:benzoate transporter [Micromonosporaceae bacterium]